MRMLKNKGVETYLKFSFTFSVECFSLSRFRACHDEADKSSSSLGLESYAALIYGCLSKVLLNLFSAAEIFALYSGCTQKRRKIIYNLCKRLCLLARSFFHHLFRSEQLLQHRRKFEKWTLNSPQMTSPEKRCRASSQQQNEREKLCIINFCTIIYQVSWEMRAELAEGEASNNRLGLLKAIYAVP